MAEKTGIEWATSTWNPWMGCQKVSQGCAKCYMFREMTYRGRDPHTVVRTKTTFNAPLKWARGAKNAPAAGARIFTCSYSDWFIEDADDWRPEAWHIIRRTPQYTYLILTKRPERIAAHLPHDWGDGWDNVWLGVSAEDQANADKRIPLLLSVPAAVRFVSAEPLLGPLDLSNAFAMDAPFRLHWIITGGESDLSKPRPMNLDWARSLRDQCQAAGVAYFHKQNGGTRRCACHGAWGCRLLDGRTWDQLPQVTHA